MSAEEAALWSRVTATIAPLHAKPTRVEVAAVPPAEPTSAPPAKRVRGRVPPARIAPPPPVPPRTVPVRHGLDSSWDRKLARGSVEPDVTIDLHGLGLDAAHARLDAALGQALAMGARVMLLIAGKARPHDETDSRGGQRGVIRARLVDWLAAGPHSGRIAAIRPAQPRHGGAGAVYIVLRKPR
ncbi:Smr/MutS family protein [Novosphingobium lentum]|uniref:Smr/MutS family protein n=1 Tax=Novosphingobium lentum TaxID=145287 RepID=UPI000AEE2F19|nr:Smr/MutS family protein [Novosphingobium lentum]